MPLFLFILKWYINSITFMQYIHPSSFAEVSLHLHIACHLSGKKLPGVPSRESNSGLPYSKPKQFTIRRCPCDYQGLFTLLYLAEENNILLCSVYYLGHSIACLDGAIKTVLVFLFFSIFHF